MKKLIVFLAVFALIGGVAFAQVSIGASIGFGAHVIEGDSSDKGDDDPAIFTNLSKHWGTVTLNWDSGDGVAAAKIKINGDTNKDKNGFDPSDGGKVIDYFKMGAGVWWRPLEILKIEFSDLEDEGVFGRGNAIDWGYQSNSSAGNAAALWEAGWNSFSNAALRSGNGFFGGLGGGGQKVLALSLFPIDGLTLNFAWNMDNGGDTVEFFKTTLAQLTYDINGIGNLGVSFKGNDDWSRVYGYGTGQKIAQTLGVDFTLTALAGMNVEVGALIPAAAKINTSWSGYDNGTDATLPVEIGLGFTMNQWTSEAFQMFARAGMVLPTEDTGNITAIGLDVNPSYDLGIFRAFFDFGIALVSQKDNDDSNFFWHFTPYIKKDVGIGSFYCGLNLWNGAPWIDAYETIPRAIQPNDEFGTGLINFAVPIYFEFSL